MSRRAWWRLAAALGVLFLGDLLWMGIRFPWAMRHRTFQVETLPVNGLPVLVLGASVVGDREPSPVLMERLQTALTLYRQGRVRWFLVSGDNRSPSYNEPIVMRRWLLRQGVPPERIVSDFAGRRTRDSLRRAHAVFGLNRIVIVTSQYHLPRALYLAQGMGLEAWGVPAPTRRASWLTRTSFWTREHFARHAAILDTWFPPATTLGPREPTPEDWLTAPPEPAP